MLKLKRVVATSMLVIIPLTVLAQNNTNSPYTRYGYGELADRSFGAGRAMGGIGYGLRSNKQINPMNPASYTSMDSLTFIFDFGVAAQLSWFDDGINKERNTNGNLEYLAFSFPVSRRIAVSAGILPYSYVGYDYGATTTSADGITYVNRYTGDGGLNEAYAGLSIDIWKKRLSIGANISYMFGNISHNQTLSLPESTGSTANISQDKLEVRDWKLDFGVQYTHPFSATESFVVGAAFSPGKELNTTSYNIFYEGSSLTQADTTKNHTFDIPYTLGFGASYVKENKLTLAADFKFENWSQAHYFDSKDQFKNRIRVAGGGEYIPNYQSRGFFSRVRYRAGVHYSNSYLKIKDSSYNEYGAGIGIGLPLIDNRSLLNLSFEYVKIKPETRALVDEQYFRVTLNYTFNEFWFFKSRVQ